MRPGKKVARAVLIAGLATVALPGLVGSRLPSPERPIDAAAFRTLPASAFADREGVVIEPLDPAFRSAGSLDADATFIEPGVSRSVPTKAPISQPEVERLSVLKPPRYTISGYASFYGAGSTAMRLPYGTVVIVCGAGGCLERVVTDYGPSASLHPDRIIDLYTPDFFSVCGCPSWTGTTRVTVKVY